MISRRTFLCSMALGALPASSWAKASRMRIVVPYPAGGPLDACARLLAQALQSKRGRVIVENRPGAAGARAMLEVKNASADGLTLVMGALATLVVNPLLSNDLPYRPEDFKAVTLLSDTPNVLVMTPSTMEKLRVSDARQLIEYIKTHPDKLNCASGGTGSAGHIVNAVFNAQGLKTVHVPYAGAMAAQLSLFSGETDLMFDNYANAQAAVTEKRLVVLAQTRALADAAINAPTLHSLGVDCDISTWFGLLAPEDTPAVTCEKLFEEIKTVLSEKTLREKFDRLSGGTQLLGPAAFEKWIADEQVKYRSFVNALQI